MFQVTLLRVLSILRIFYYFNLQKKDESWVLDDLLKNISRT